MRKKFFLRCAVSLALTAWLAFSPQGAPAVAGTFKDTETHWSRVVVDKSYALGLMKGYPGDVFMPEDPVTRLEAIAVIINAMGLEKEAKNVDYKNSGINLPKGMFWGQGYLVIAVQKGLLHKDYVHQLLYGSPIPRQEVATLVAVALREKIKTKGDPGKLTFTDTGEINPTHLPYVADVTQNNIMQGLGSNEFGPNQIMKRGQMAALLVKTTQEGWFDYGTGRIIRGTLSTFDSVAGVISITKEDGIQIPKLVENGAVFYKDSKPSSLDRFIIGEAITAITTPEGKVRYLEGAASTASNNPGTQTELAGKVIDRYLTGTSSLKIRDAGNQEKSFPLDTVITITDGVNARDLSNVTDGTFVKVKIKNNSIQNILILSPEVVTGEVNSIIPGYITIKADSGSSRIFSINSAEMKVLKGNSWLAFSELKIGDRVIITSASGEALEIALTTLNLDKAEIRTIDPYYRLISISDSNFNRKEYEVDLQALIKKGNRTIPISELKVGDEVSIKVGENGKITQILMDDNSLLAVYGTVTDLWAGSYPRIAIDSIRYTIPSGTPISRNGSSIGLKDIIPGAKVKFKLDNYNAVKSIEVTDDQNITVEGMVTDINPSEGKITLELQNRLEYTLPIISDCIIYDQTYTTSSRLNLYSITRGWTVKAYLSGRTVKELEVKSR